MPSKACDRVLSPSFILTATLTVSPTLKSVISFFLRSFSNSLIISIIPPVHIVGNGLKPFPTNFLLIVQQIRPFIFCYFHCLFFSPFFYFFMVPGQKHIRNLHAVD